MYGETVFFKEQALSRAVLTLHVDTGLSGYCAAPRLTSLCIGCAGLMRRDHYSFAARRVFPGAVGAPEMCEMCVWPILF